MNEMSKKFKLKDQINEKDCKLVQTQKNLSDKI